MRTRITIVAAIVSAMLSIGCLSPHQSTAVDVDATVWSAPATLLLPNADTTTLRDLHLFFRCTDRFSADSVSFRIVFHTPDSSAFEEFFSASFPSKITAAALHSEFVVPYRRQVCFKESGNYRLQITPLQPLQGVESVGINISKSNQTDNHGQR